MKQYWIMVIMYEAILDNGKHNSTYLATHTTLPTYVME